MPVQITSPTRKAVVKFASILLIQSAVVIIALVVSIASGESWLSRFALVLIVLYIGGVSITAELFARVLLRNKFPSLGGDGTPGSLRMQPNIFTHYVPSSDHPDIQNHFRKTSTTTGQTKGRTLYIAGDCVAFEDHLPPEETMAYQLASLLPDWQVLNAGSPHYSTPHAYNRLVFDLLRGYRPSELILFSGINDVLGFLHHKDGDVGPVHTHVYVPWLPYGGRGAWVRRMPSALLKVIAAYGLAGKRAEVWDHLAEKTDIEFFDPDHVHKGQELFETATFMTCLGLLHAICKEAEIQLRLTTVVYNRPDMDKGSRSAYAWGVDRINGAIREFASSRDLPLVDLNKELSLIPEADVRNKWHFTRSGNAKRAEAVKMAISCRPA